VNKSTISRCFVDIIQSGLGLDITDPDISPTPDRIADMYTDELFAGVGKEFDDFALSPNVHNYNQIVMSDCITFSSMCAHHFLPFQGQAWVAYLPSENLIGLSKMSRIVSHYAARPQLQENLTHEVINNFVQGLKPRGAMVVLRCTHACMSCRGARQNSGSGMITSAINGEFLTDPDLKIETIMLILMSLLIK